MLGSARSGVAPPDSPHRPYRLLAFGGSAGAITALRDILSRLSPDFPIPIVVVQHLGAAFRSRLPEVLRSQTRLRCKWAESGDAPVAGQVYVAQPGANLVLTAGGTLLVVPDLKPRFGWPSVDLFLTSMALHLGCEAIAVVLSGCLRDGSEGVAAIRRCNGATMVQHPALADFPGMPSAAVDLGKADLMMSPARIAEAVQILAECGVP